MTDDTVRQVLEHYRAVVTARLEAADRSAALRRSGVLRRIKLTHVRDVMLPQMVPWVGVPGREDKVMRWLGFVQGVLWSCGVFTIDQLKAHNAPESEPHIVSEGGTEADADYWRQRQAKKRSGQTDYPDDDELTDDEVRTLYRQLRKGK
jgi:hypothetical protein